jgi:hypothetical protein
MSRILALLLRLATTFAAAPTPDLLLQHGAVIDMIGAPPRQNVEVLVHAGACKNCCSHRYSCCHACHCGARELPHPRPLGVHIWNADLAFPLFLANGIPGL